MKIVIEIENNQDFTWIGKIIGQIARYYFVKLCFKIKFALHIKNGNIGID